MDASTKFVDFERWCPQCEHKDVDAVDEPCNTCLETGARFGTEIPEKFKPTDAGKKFMEEHHVTLKPKKKKH